MSRLAVRHVAAQLLGCDAQFPGLTDADLLARFAAARDEGAFAELVARHGGLVRGTARRWVRDAHAAEDVCQAAFLVLAKKAGAVTWGGTVGPWLHATTVRLARKAACRVRAASAGPVPETPVPPTDPAADLAWGESCRVLDEELTALPEELRGPLVLCYLQGRTRDEAARALGCSLAMLKRRLERGRNLLRDRLTRRGVTLPAVGVGILASELARACPVEATARAAVAFVARGTVRPGAAALLDVSRGAFALKACALVAAGLVACATAFGSLWSPATETADAPAEPPAAAPAEPPADPKADADVPSEALPPSAIARLGSLRLRTLGAVERLAFSPDGTKLASWGGDLYTSNDLTIWDTKTGRALRRHALPGAKVDLLAWLPDGRGVALVRSNLEDPVPVIWEFTDDRAAKPEAKPRKPGGMVFAVPNGPAQDNEHDACFAISPDGKILAVGKAGQLQADREVQLWELETGLKTNALKPLKGGVIHPGNCGEIRFTPDSKTLVVLTKPKFLGGDKFEGEQLVTVWDVKNGKEKVRFKAPRPATNTRSAVALSNTTLALGLENGDTSLWDLTAGKERVLETGHKGKKPGQGFGTYAVAFLPDGKTLMTAGRDHVTKLWELSSGKLRHTLDGHSTWVEALAAAPNGKLVASAGQDGLIRIWNPTTGADACPLPGHKYGVWHVAFSADGRTAVTGGWDNTVRWWDATLGTELRTITVRGGLLGMALSPDGKVVLTATDENKLQMWERDTGREVAPAHLPAEVKFEHLSFSRDGKTLVAACGPRVTLWEWPALKLVRTIELPPPNKAALPNLPENAENWCQVAALSPDGKWLVTVAHCHWYRERDGLRFGYGSHGVADVWDPTTGKRVRRLAESPGTYRSGGFTAEGRFVLTGAGGTILEPDGTAGPSFDGEVNLLDPIAGRAVRGFEPPPVPENVSFRYIASSALSPDGETLYVSLSSGEIVCYEVATGKARRTLTGHRGHVAGLVVSADGRRLLSGGQDGTALVWNVALAGSPAPRGNRPTDAEKLWDAIGGSDAKAAFEALVELASAPDQRAVGFVRERIKPAPTAPTDATLDRIFADLDSPEAASRAKAVKELSEFGELAVRGCGSGCVRTRRRRCASGCAPSSTSSTGPRRARRGSGRFALWNCWRV